MDDPNAVITVSQDTDAPEISPPQSANLAVTRAAAELVDLWKRMNTIGADAGVVAELGGTAAMNDRFAVLEATLAVQAALSST